jgi:hypothetical protein
LRLEADEAPKRSIDEHGRFLTVFAEKLMNPRDQDPMVAGELPGDRPAIEQPMADSYPALRLAVTQSMPRSGGRNRRGGSRRGLRVCVPELAAALARRRRRRTIGDCGTDGARPFIVESLSW